VEGIQKNPIIIVKGIHQKYDFFNSYDLLIICFLDPIDSKNSLNYVQN